MHADMSLAWRRRRNASGVGADLRRIFSHRLLGLPNQNERQNCKARRGPAPDFGGSERVEKIPSLQPSQRWGGASNANHNWIRAMGPECRCAVPNAH